MEAILGSFTRRRQPSSPQGAVSLFTQPKGLEFLYSLGFVLFHNPFPRKGRVQVRSATEHQAQGTIFKQVWPVETAIGISHSSRIPPTSLCQHRKGGCCLMQWAFKLFRIAQ
jgi:hypothetical protein